MSLSLQEELPQAIYTTEQIRELERLTVAEQEISVDILMQRAGEVAFTLLQQQWPSAKTIKVFCGSGNNGGDGYVLARQAHLAGLQVVIYQVGDCAKLAGAAFHAKDACLKLGISMQTYQIDLDLQCDVIVDAMVGIGLRDELTDNFLSAIAQINASGLPVLALDIPSGLQADTGVVANSAIQASHTACFIGLKIGLLTGEGPDYVGTLHCYNLGLTPAIYKKINAHTQRLSSIDLASLHKFRRRTAHKNNFGHVLIIGGDYGMGGAVRLAGEAALRTGAGLVTVATRSEHIGLIGSGRSELLCYGVKAADELTALIDRATVIVIGPGLGRSAWSAELLKQALLCTKPMVVDADALNSLAEQPAKSENWILTPHPGEAGRLLQLSVKEIQNDRIHAIKLLQKQYGGVCVLKGAGTLVFARDNPLFLCSAGNPGMATAGTGDVLSGIIAGLWAQGFDSMAAAGMGVQLHAMAGDRAAYAGERGMVALDIVQEIRGLVNPAVTMNC